MASKKVIRVVSALLLALFVGYRPMPVRAQVVTCDPLDPAADCDNDGIPNGTDTCNNLDPTADCDNDGVPNGNDTCNNLDPLADCDNDGIPNGSDTCNNVDPAADCDGDGVANGVDQCPATIEGGDLMIGDIPLSGFGDTILPTGCSLAESLATTIQACAGVTPGTQAALKKPKGGPNGKPGKPGPGGPGDPGTPGTPKNHGQFVSCVAHATNALKKAKVITGQQKGEIMSAAAQADIP
ncbi:MAG TPA: thrombospondin type 3 repeat-containing protein [Candidatus Binatia bacterium]